MSNLLGGEQSMLEKLMAAQERIAELEAECERLRVNANIGSVVWKYIDRMGDVVPSDPAARILCEFYHAVLPVIGAAKESA